MPRVDADLVRAASERAGLHEGGAVGVATQHGEFGDGFQRAALGGAAAGFVRLVGDGGLAGELILRGMTVDSGEVMLLDFASMKLPLQLSGKMAGATHDSDSGGVGIDAVRGPRALGVKGDAEQIL